MDDKSTSYTLGKHSANAGLKRHESRNHEDRDYEDKAHESKERDERSLGKHSKEYLGKHSKENLEKKVSSSDFSFSDSAHSDSADRGAEKRNSDVEKILMSLKQENPASRDTEKFKSVRQKGKGQSSKAKGQSSKEGGKQSLKEDGKQSSKEDSKQGAKEKSQDKLEVADASRRLIISKKASDLFTENERLNSKDGIDAAGIGAGADTADADAIAASDITSPISKVQKDKNASDKASSKSSKNKSGASKSADKSTDKNTAKNEELDQEEIIIKRRQSLKRILIIAIALLVILAIAGIGTAIFLNSNSQTSDNASLTSDEQSTQTAKFSPINQDALPSFAAYFGKPLSDLVSAYDKRIVLNGEKSESNDPEIPALVSLQHANLFDSQNTNIGTLAFGLDENDALVYVYCMADLDAMHVADASFEQLIADKTLPVSFLIACGIKQGVANTAALSQQEKPTCINDAKAQEGGENPNLNAAFFTGQTGQTQAPQTWKLTEKYDGSIGKTLGDNSVLRTVTVELY